MVSKKTNKYKKATSTKPNQSKLKQNTNIIAQRNTTRERETERERERERERESETDRQTNRQTNRQTDRQT